MQATQEQLLDVEAAAERVTSTALAQLLDHVRRGSAGALWTAVQASCATHFAALQEASAGRGAAPVPIDLTTAQGCTATHAAAAQAQGMSRLTLLSAAWWAAELQAAKAAHAAGSLAQAVEYYRGSRVEALAPLFGALGEACTALQAAAGAVPSCLTSSQHSTEVLAHVFAPVSTFRSLLE